ncbi:MAG TPA: cupin domain-containing protein [Gaiellaceae bacterium]|nr:cupin domain-containing protein [Gaiellaceae bacterium]
MIPEAPLRRTDAGLVPEGDGWFVVNAREARWWADDAFGAFTRFEGEERFPRVGINVGVLEPGQPSCMYHREDEQEDFLVLAGECLLLVEGEERRLRAWDFVHCPPWTEHVFVGAGERECVLLAIGTRSGGDVVYPVAEVALRRRAGVERETPSPEEAYAGYSEAAPAPYRDDWLPDR